MKTYHIINTSDRSTRHELIHYTFDQVKKYFEPDKTELPEEWECWNQITNITELEDYLNEEAAGMEQPYIFEEDSVDNLEEMERANKFFKTYK